MARKIKFTKLNTLLTIKVSKDINYHLVLYDNHAPMPSDIYDEGGFFLTLTWRIDGSFNTIFNKQYFNDVREKLSILLSGISSTANHLLKGITSSKDPFIAMHKKYSKHQEIYKLTDFRHLEDNRTNRTKVLFNKYSKMSTFKRVRITGYALQQEGNLSLEELDLAVMRYSDNYKADKYMAKAVYNWIRHKVSTGDYWVSDKPKKITIPRKDNALIQSKKIFECNFKRFKTYVNFFGLDEFNISELAKKLNFSRPTIYKFINIYLNLKSVKSIGTIGGVSRVKDKVFTNVLNYTDEIIEFIRPQIIREPLRMKVHLE